MQKRCKRVLALLIALFIAVGVLQPEESLAATSSTYYIKVNRQQNCVTVYAKDDKGKYTVPVRAMVCSTGANNATPAGKFRIGGKYRWHELDGPVYGQYCSRITGHVLFHSVYYSTTDPSTLNYNAYNKLGRSVSHGCVRLTVEDAKWIYDNCPTGTVVEVYDSSNPGPLGKPEPIKIDVNSRYRGWDPTDPDKNNPWPKTVKSGPTIKGAKDRTIERGSAKSKVTSGVSAQDRSGKKLKVKVSGKYDLNKTGKYSVTYTATDADGNKTSQTVTITVKDTKAPKVTLLEKELTINDETDAFDSLGSLKTYIKKYVKAEDSGEALSAKYIVVSANDLWKAWGVCEYGTYKVTVYAKDKAGNKSKSKTITVRYEEISEEVPDDSEAPDTELPGDTDDGTGADNTGDASVA